MAKKVLDTKSGNPYHNEGNGQFTSPNDNDKKENSIEQQEAFKLLNVNNDKKENVKKIFFPNNFRANKTLLEAKRLAQQEEYEEKGLEIGETIDDCKRIGEQLLTIGKCAYSNNLNIDFANEFNQALFDFKNDFGGILDNILRYGDDVLNKEDVEKIRLKGKQNIDKLVKTINPEPWGFNANIINSYLNTLNNYRHFFQEKASEGTLGYTNLGDVFGSSYKRSERYSMITSLSQGGFDDTFNRLTTFPVVVFNTKDFGNESSFLSSKTDFKFNPAKNKDDFTGNLSYPNQKGHAYGTAAHELGHRVDMTLCLNHMSKDEIKKRNSLLRAIRKSGTSRYAFEDFFETAAEAFNDVYSNVTPNNPKNSDYVNFMKSMYKKYFSNEVEQNEV